MSQPGPTPNEGRLAVNETLHGADPDEHVRIQRQDIYDDAAEERAKPIPGWLSTQRARRTLAVTAAVPLTLAVVNTVIGGVVDWFVTLLTFVTAGVIGLLLRRATTVLAEAPEAVLDERELSERHQAYQSSYGLLSWLLLLLPAVAGAAILTDGRWPTPDGWLDLTIGLILTTGILPSAVTAWRWRTAD